MPNPNTPVGRQLHKVEKAYWRARLGSFGHGSHLGRPRQLTNGKRVHIGDATKINAGARLEVVPAVEGEDPRGELRIGRDVRVEDFAHFGAADRIEIGDLCLIASFVYITDHDHGMGGTAKISSEPLIVRPVTIGRRVWLGHGAVVLKGVTVGDGAIVAAGAVVTKDVEAGAVVAGVPARPVARSETPQVSALQR